MHLIDHQWRAGEGEAFQTRNPATGDTVWTGRAATAAQVDGAVAAARRAFASWSDLPLTDRAAFLHAYARELEAQRPSLAEAICLETGKPHWESLTEVSAMIGKVAASIDAYHERRAETTQSLNGVAAATRFKPLGVVAVLGPFNFPGHLPNGHIVPALLAGNTVIFKPSERTAGVAQRMMECLLAAGLPRGAVNLVQGARDTGRSLVEHPDLQGVYFTGSYAGGKALSEALASRPEVVLALEMGGNNPLVVWDAKVHDAAAYLTVQSAFLTAGQRCSCARRLIAPEGAEGERLLQTLVALAQRIRVGRWDAQPPPFIGPVIAPEAAAHLLAAQQDLIERGATALLPMRLLDSSGGAMLSPGIVDVTPVADRRDEELFGPLLQVIRVPTFDAALQEANRTAYGLVAALLSDSPELYQQFYRTVRAGLINWNRPTTGASGRLPFGGIGQSGNGRPSGYYASDYCSYPIASVETPTVAMPAQTLPGIQDA